MERNLWCVEVATTVLVEPSFTVYGGKEAVVIVGCTAGSGITGGNRYGHDLRLDVLSPSLHAVDYRFSHDLSGQQAEHFYERCPHYLVRLPVSPPSHVNRSVVRR